MPQIKSRRRQLHRPKKLMLAPLYYAADWREVFSLSVNVKFLDNAIGD